MSKGNYMMLHHYCSIKSLIEIISSGRYIPAYDDPIAYDFGLNCFSEGQFHDTGQAISREAVLILKWKGAIKETPKSARTPFDKNILHVQEEWRSFVAEGTDKRLIEIIDFEVNDVTKFEEKCTLAWYYKIFSEVKKKDIINNQCEKLKQEINSQLPIDLSIKK